MTERGVVLLAAAVLTLVTTPAPATSLAAPATALDSVNQCASELTITTSTPLTFGVISVDPDIGGVVIVSPTAAVATLGSVAVGPDASPAMIHLCGPAGTEFIMQVDPSEQELTSTDPGGRPALVRNLEATASGAELHPTGAGQWQGTLGARGATDIRIGGSLTIPARQKLGTFAAPFSVRIDPLN